MVENLKDESDLLTKIERAINGEKFLTAQALIPELDEHVQRFAYSLVALGFESTYKGELPSSVKQFINAYRVEHNCYGSNSETSKD